MTDPRVLVRLDVIVGLLGLVAALLALQVILAGTDLGLVAIGLVAVAGAIAAREYRQLLDEAGG